MASYTFRHYDPCTAMRGDQSVAQQAGNSHGANAARHRCDRASMTEGIVKGNVADQPALALPISGRKAVDTDIDDHRARFQPVAGYHFSAADGCDNNIRAPHDIGQILRAAMRNGDGAIFREQQLRHWFANNVGPSDHDGILAGQIADMVF
jgi:hypothetical protein